MESFRTLLNLGAVYTKARIADLSGHSTADMQVQGIVRLADYSSILIFVTYEQDGQYAYPDEIAGSEVKWCGQKKHGRDGMVVGAAEDERDILLFYRRHTHEFSGGAFRFLGAVEYVDKLELGDATQGIPALYELRRKGDDFALLPDHENTSDVANELDQTAALSYTTAARRTHAPIAADRANADSNEGQVADRPPFTMKIHVSEGKPSGRLEIAIDGWNGRVYSVPRELAESAGRLRELQDRPGIYILSEETTDKRRIYVGKSTSVGDRLASHAKDRSKHWWRRALVGIGGADGQLTLQDLAFLENRLLAAARTNPNLVVTNEQTPTDPNLDHFEIHAAESFVQRILAVTYVLGCPLTE